MSHASVLRRLPLWLAGGALALTGGALALAGCAPEGSDSAAGPESGAARLVPGSDRVDFGAVFEGTPLAHRFELRAAGAAPVRIERLHKTCGCTSAELFEIGSDGVQRPYELGSELQPGEQLVVEVEFDTLGRPGAQERTLALYGEIPDGRVQLAVAAQVRPLVASQPEFLDWGRLLQGERREGRLTLTSVTGLPLGLRVVEAGIPAGFELELAPVEPDAEGRSVAWSLDVASAPGLLVGGGRWYLPLEAVLPEPGPTGEPLTAPVRATVQATVLPIVQALPRLIDFGVLDRGARAERQSVLELNLEGFELPEQPRFEVELRDTAGRPADRQPFQARLEATEEGHRIVVWVDAMPAGLAGALRGRVALALDSEAQPTLALGFSVVATDR